MRGKIKNSIHWGDKEIANFQMRFLEYISLIFKLKLVSRKVSENILKESASSFTSHLPIWRSGELMLRF